MNKKTVFLSLFFCAFYFLCHSEESYKQQIQQLQSQLANTSLEDSGSIQIRLSVTYYKDQQPEQSFHTFLKALDAAPKVASTPDKEDCALYEKALKIYLEGKTPQEAAQAILKDYEEIATIHPTYYQLGYLIAIAHANLEQFPLFFEKFYQSYLRYPNHYLAYKTKAVVFIKLISKGRTPAEKEKWRKEVISNLREAYNAFPKDASLCKMLLAFVSEEQKQEMLIYCLNKILANNTMIPRTDIVVYVRQAVNYKQIELAQHLVDKAREWYSYSRTVEEAQRIIDENY